MASQPTPDLSRAYLLAALDELRAKGLDDAADHFARLLDGDILVVDQDGVFRTFPVIREAIDEWIKNRDPKLPNLRIEVRTHIETLHNPPTWEVPGIEITLKGILPYGRCEETRLIGPTEKPFLRYLTSTIDANLDVLHLTLLRAMRDDGWRVESPGTEASRP